MSKVQQFRDVTIPDEYDDWPADAQINFLCNCLDREQIANYVREEYGLEPRDKPLFRKDELAQIAIAGGHDGD